MHDISKYKELYHYDSKRTLVIDKMTGEVWMMKRLSYYEEEVYRYLMEHKNVHIPSVEDYFKDDENNLIVIEEIVQGNSFDVIINDHNMPEKVKLEYFRQLLAGLSFLHKASTPIIHRDLKPSNIMITDRGEVMILDYDAARIYKPDSSGDTTHLGTSGMAAPEQYGFMQSDPRSDIYAVGRMIKAAFPGNKRLQKIAAKASSFDPAERYSTAEMLSDVMLNHKTAISGIKPLFPPPGFRTHTWWKIMLAVASYPFLLAFSVGSFVYDFHGVETVLFGIYITLFILICIDVCNSWTGLFDILPFIKHRHFLVRSLFKLIFITLIGVALFFSGMFTGAIILFFFPFLQS